MVYSPPSSSLDSLAAFGLAFCAGLAAATALGCYIAQVRATANGRYPCGCSVSAPGADTVAGATP